VNDLSFHERVQRVEELIAAVQEHGNAVVRASAVEMVRTLLDLHRTGLAKMMELADGRAKDFVADEVVSRLLLLHGLHPVELATRVRQALDEVRPLLVRHGVAVDVVEATHDVVRLRVWGLRPEVQSLLEEMLLEAAPDVLRIEFVDANAPASSLISLPLVAGI
jgi:hypothetical protein